MRKLLLFIPLMLSAAEPSKPIDIPPKVKIFNFPKEVVAGEQERSARRKKRLSNPIDLAASLTLPSPNLNKSESPTPYNSPEKAPMTILWDVIIEGKVWKIKVGIEPA